MKAAFVRFALIVCMISTMTVLSSGCTVGGKSFAIDSNSRVPFFGLELKEGKRKASAPAYRSIARSPSDEISVKVALQSLRSAPTVDLKERSTQLVSTKFTTESTDLTGDRSKKIRPAVPVTTAAEAAPGISLPLPRTDGLPLTRDRRASAAFVDFQ